VTLRKWWSTPRSFIAKLLLKSGNDTAEKWLTGGCEDNIINIEQQVCSVRSMVIDKQRCIRLGLHKP
jgi:hypothetical protein